MEHLINVDHESGDFLSLHQHIQGLISWKLTIIFSFIKLTLRCTSVSNSSLFCLYTVNCVLQISLKYTNFASGKLWKTFIWKSIFLSYVILPIWLLLFSEILFSVARNFTSWGGELFCVMCLVGADMNLKFKLKTVCLFWEYVQENKPLLLLRRPACFLEKFLTWQVDWSFARWCFL